MLLFGLVSHCVWWIWVSCSPARFFLCSLWSRRLLIGRHTFAASTLLDVLEYRMGCLSPCKKYISLVHRSVALVCHPLSNNHAVLYTSSTLQFLKIWFYRLVLSRKAVRSFPGGNHTQKGEKIKGHWNNAMTKKVFAIAAVLLLGLATLAKAFVQTQHVGVARYVPSFWRFGLTCLGYMYRNEF